MKNKKISKFKKVKIFSPCKPTSNIIKAGNKIVKAVKLKNI